MTYRRSTLENGIRVVTDRRAHSRSVSIGVVVEAGPFSEEPRRGGLAHLCEHMLFQGTSSRTALDIARIMDHAGGSVGGFTSRDYTNYYAVVTDDYATFALDLLGDVFLNPVFPQASIDSEKHAIRCEIQARLDDPEHRVHDLLKSHVWSGHPLGRAITGTIDSIDTLDREALIYFLHQHYLPERIVIAGAGHIEHDDFVAHVRDAFWRMLPSGAPTPRRRAADFHPGLIIDENPTRQAYFAIGLAAPAYTAENRYAVHVLTRLLGGGLSSRLFRLLRDEHGMVYEIHASYQAYRDAGLIVIEGSTLPQNVVPVVATICQELIDLGTWQRPIDEEELVRAKAQLTAQTILSGEDSHSSMARLATQEIYFGRYLGETELLDAIDRVDLTALEHLSRHELRLDTTPKALTVSTPDASSIEAEADALRDLLGMHVPTESHRTLF
ncbi:MAG: pitrilysin family protein [Acidobacteriota bacterium]